MIAPTAPDGINRVTVSWALDWPPEPKMAVFKLDYRLNTNRYMVGNQVACYCGRDRGTFEFGLDSDQGRDSAGTLTAYQSIKD